MTSEPGVCVKALNNRFSVFNRIWDYFFLVRFIKLLFSKNLYLI
jgi:hypothetical protein